MKKILIAVHGGNRKQIEEKYQVISSLDNICRKAGLETDIYLYTETKESLMDIWDGFPGAVFVDRYWHLEAAAASERIARLFLDRKYEGIFFAVCSVSNDIAALTALDLSLPFVTDAMDAEFTNQGLTVHRMAYNNNIRTCILLPSCGFVVAFTMLAVSGCKMFTNKGSHICRIIELPARTAPSYILSEKKKQERNDEMKSDVLIAAGRGVRTKAEIESIRKFAQSKKCMFGVTRAVAMNGWGRMDEIIGVSGSIYAPEICIVIGASGAAAFYAGIEQSGYILSVNIDEKAPIISMSDESIVDDYRDVLPQLLEFS